MVIGNLENVESTTLGRWVTRVIKLINMVLSSKPLVVLWSFRFRKKVWQQQDISMKTCNIYIYIIRLVEEPTALWYRLSINMLVYNTAYGETGYFVVRENKTYSTLKVLKAVRGGLHKESANLIEFFPRSWYNNRRFTHKNIQTDRVSRGSVSFLWQSYNAL